MKDTWASGTLALLRRADSHNWKTQGRTFEDLDGYRVVLQNAVWTL